MDHDSAPHTADHVAVKKESITHDNRNLSEADAAADATQQRDAATAEIKTRNSNMQAENASIQTSV